MANSYYKQHWIDVEPHRHAAYEKILAFSPALEPFLRPLEVKPGLRVLDVGSGPGHTTVELARLVAPLGHVTGVDLNAEFLRVAARRARDSGMEVTFVRGEFPGLPFSSASFDRVLCKNVLEYVDSAADTVIEMARVAAPGAVVVAIDSDWEMLALDLPAPARDRSDAIIAAARALAVHEPKIGRMLYRLFRNAGLTEVRVEVFAGADTVGRAAPMLKVSLAQYARDSGQFAKNDIDEWLRDLDNAIADGSYCFVLPQFVVRGLKK